MVEDDLNLIDGLEYSIRKNGFHVDTARTVQEALCLYENNKYDLLVLDLTLPDGTGFEICQKVGITLFTTLLSVIGPVKKLNKMDIVNVVNAQ